MDEWVLRTACEQNRAWQLLGLPPMRVAVNLSARQFLQANTVKTIAKILAETGLAPDALEIEITESIAMTDVNFTVSILQQLQEMGIQISRDDFGTGYSSLWSLKEVRQRIRSTDVTDVSKEDEGSSATDSVMDVTDVSKEDEGSSAEDTALPCPSRVLTVGNMNSDATGHHFTAKQTLSLRILASQS